MSITIVPHAQDKRDLVERFNRRMRAGGSPWGFYVEHEPRWPPQSRGVWRELHLAMEDGGDVVGAYALKPQRWLIRGAPHTLTDWQGPFSLGAVDSRYAALGLRLVRDMLRKQPLLYSWGHGGHEEPMVRMLRTMGWLLHETPFLLRIVEPVAFLRRNAYLRRDARLALVQDLLAWSGLGWLGLHAVHKALRVRSLGRLRARCEVVPSFGPWADDVWERARGRYDAIAVRDAETMNVLVPARHRTREWPSPTRLKVSRGGVPIGWAVVLTRALSGDDRFGDLRVGMVADCLAEPREAAAVVHAAFAHLRDEAVDMVIANQAHPEWVRAFVRSGFVAVPRRRCFCASPALEKLLEPFEHTRRGLFLTNMDGHGPMI